MDEKLQNKLFKIILTTLLLSWICTSSLFLACIRLDKKVTELSATYYETQAEYETTRLADLSAYHAEIKAVQDAQNEFSQEVQKRFDALIVTENEHIAITEKLTELVKKIAKENDEMEKWR